MNCAACSSLFNLTLADFSDSSKLAMVTSILVHMRSNSLIAGSFDRTFCCCGGGNEGGESILLRLPCCTIGGEVIFCKVSVGTVYDVVFVGCWFVGCRAGEFVGVRSRVILSSTTI